MLRISAPPPTRFLVFALFAEVPKGDYVLKELAQAIKTDRTGHSCTASSLLITLNTLHPVSTLCTSPAAGATYSALEEAVGQAKAQSRKIDEAKLTTEYLKDEGIADSFAIFLELLKPATAAVPPLQDIVRWRRPVATCIFIAAALIIIYKEWLGKVLAGVLLWGVWKVLRRSAPAADEIVVRKSGDKKSTVESIVSAQHGLVAVHKLLQNTNISLLKIRSLFCYKPPKQSKMAVVGAVFAAVVLAAVPLKFLLMAAVIQAFASTSAVGRYFTSEDGNRRVKEWWDSIPVVNVRLEE